MMKHLKCSVHGRSKWYSISNGRFPVEAKETIETLATLTNDHTALDNFGSTLRQLGICRHGEHGMMISVSLCVS